MSHKSAKGKQGAVEDKAHIWLTAFDYLVSSQIQLFACDSEGSLYVFESTDGRASNKHDNQDWRDSKDIQFQLLTSQIGIHKNGISQVLIVHKENIFFTIGLDQQLMWFEMTVGNKQLAVLKNP